MCVHGLTGCTVRIVAFDEFLILVNLVSIDCSTLIHFDSPSVYCIFMSMRMGAGVETSEAFDQKDHNEFVTTCDVEYECVSMVLQGVLLELLLSMSS